eukprot:4691768-Amphidinium_carterae.1
MLQESGIDPTKLAWQAQRFHRHSCHVQMACEAKPSEMKAQSVVARVMSSQNLGLELEPPNCPSASAAKTVSKLDRHEIC